MARCLALSLCFAFVMGSSLGCELFASGLSCTRDSQCPEGETCERGRCELLEEEDVDRLPDDENDGTDDAGDIDDRTPQDGGPPDAGFRDGGIGDGGIGDGGISDGGVGFSDGGVRDGGGGSFSDGGVGDAGD